MSFTCRRFIPRFFPTGPVFRMALAITGLAAALSHAQFNEREIGIFKAPIYNWNMWATQTFELWIGGDTPYPLPAGVETAEIIGASVVIYDDNRAQIKHLIHLAQNLNGLVHDWNRGGQYALSCHDVGSPATARCLVRMNRGPQNRNVFSKSGADYDAAGFRGWITLEYRGAPTHIKRIHKNLGPWSIPQATATSTKSYIDKAYTFAPSAPALTLLDMDATIHSDPAALWVEPFGNPGAPIANKTHEFFGRGGSVMGSYENKLVLHVPFSHAAFDNGTVTSRFHLGLHKSTTANRGWARITSESPQSFPNPNYIKTKVVPLGSRVLVGNSVFYIPLQNVVNIPRERVVELSAFVFTDPFGGLAIRDASPFVRTPPIVHDGSGGGEKMGGKIHLRSNGNIYFHYASYTMNPPYPMEYFWGDQTKLDDPSVQRGWLRVDYQMASCSEGSGFTRNAIGYAANGDDCHGNYQVPGGARGHHVIQTKGSGIREGATSDAFYYAHRIFPSFPTVEVTVDQVENTSTSAKAGLMLRGAATTPPAANAPHLSLMVTAGNEIQIITRPEAGKPNEFVSTMTGLKLPLKLRMKKESGTLYRLDVIEANGTGHYMGSYSMPAGNYRIGVAAGNGGAGSNLSTVGLSDVNF